MKFAPTGQQYETTHPSLPLNQVGREHLPNSADAVVSPSIDVMALILAMT